MNIARKARRQAQRSLNRQAAQAPFLPGDPPDEELRKVLHAARSQSPGEALMVVHGQLLRWPQSSLLLGCAGALCLQMGDSAAAEQFLQNATALAPLGAENYNNLGVALKNLARFEESEAAFTRAFALDPTYAEALYNLGNLYMDHGENHRAMAQFLRVLDIKPDHADALNNMGMALMATLNMPEAAEAFRCAIKAKPGYHKAMINRAQALALLGESEQTIAQIEQALAIAPHYTAERLLCFQSALICDWSVYSRFAKLPVLAPVGEEPCPPFSALPFEDAPYNHLLRSRAYAQGHFLRPEARPNPPPAEDGRLRIGYLSNDFHDHATMYLIAGLLREHDRSRFAIHAFSYGPDHDDTMSAYASAHVEQFHPIGDLSNAQAIDHIRAAHIDVLVDIKGFTQGTRSPLLGAGLAPVQAAWLGYPGSLGHPSVDYAIVDHVALPRALRHTFDEKLVWLAGSYQANDNQRPITPDQATRASHGLPETGFVFCSFNTIYKIGPEEFAIWMRLLARVEGSVLWLLAAKPTAQANLRREAAARGIDPARLIFAADVDHHQHLGRLAHADLFLDSFRVNAHTTCSDALWAGLPVLTMAGQSFAARVAASLLHAAGLPDLVTTSQAEYEARALDLALTPRALPALRQRLADQRSTCALFDTQGFTRRLEEAFCAMHARHLAGLPPADLDLA